MSSFSPEHPQKARPPSGITDRFAQIADQIGSSGESVECEQRDRFPRTVGNARKSRAREADLANLRVIRSRTYADDSPTRGRDSRIAEPVTAPLAIAAPNRINTIEARGS
jgi:hypothetical protein